MLIQMIIVQVVTFFAIVFVLRRLLYSESAKEAHRLKLLKEETTLKQRELQQKIEEAGAAYKKRMAEAEKEARTLQARTEEDAEALKRKILEKAKEDADQLIRAASNAREKMREEIAVEMRKKAPILASEIFKEALSPAVKELAHKELLKDVADKIKNTEKSVFKSKVERAEIVSAAPLSKTDRAEIESLIRHALGYEVPVHEKLDGALAAGLIIRLGAILIDGSLDNRLRQLEKEMGV